MDFWIKDHNENAQDVPVPAYYSKVQKGDTTQDLFVTASRSLQTLLTLHITMLLCSSELKIIYIYQKKKKKTVRRGHVVIANEYYIDLFAVECCLLIMRDFEMHQGLDVLTRQNEEL